jgi:SAM-dependent methyltransferase
MTEMEQLWQKYHEEQNIRFLTGSPFGYTQTHLSIPLTFFVPGTRVLEIGVGTGLTTKALVVKGCKVTAMDICPRALETVHSFTEAQILAKDAASLPSQYFDLAFCLLVTQHMADEDILFEFPHIIRSLKDSGTFFVQWACSYLPEKNNLPAPIIGALLDDTSMAQERLRTKEYASNLITQCQGEVTNIHSHFDWPDFQCSWFTTEVKQKRTP